MYSGGFKINLWVTKKLAVYSIKPNPFTGISAYRRSEVVNRISRLDLTPEHAQRAALAIIEILEGQL
jgi:hypothetical protein